MRHARADYERIQDPAGLIPADEPVFLIRGQDVVGADAVAAWANLHERAGGDPSVAAMARRHAAAMDAWGKKKHADVPSVEPQQAPAPTLDGVGDEALRGVHDDEYLRHIDHEPPETCERLACAAVREHIMAVLAAAGGDPEALGRLAHEAYNDAVNLGVRWDEIDDAMKATFRAEAQAVAAAVVAHGAAREAALRAEVERLRRIVDAVEAAYGPFDPSQWPQVQDAPTAATSAASPAPPPPDPPGRPDPHR